MKICNRNEYECVMWVCVWPVYCVKLIAQLNYLKNTILKHIVARIGKINRRIQNYYNTSFQKIVRGSIVGVQDCSESVCRSVLLLSFIACHGYILVLYIWKR